MKYVIPINEYNYASSMQIMYHGTSTKNIKSILKDGLNTNYKKIYGYDSIETTSFFYGSLESVGGTYLTKNLETAIYASTDANKKSGNNESSASSLVVICNIQKKTLKLDEDELPPTIYKISQLSSHNVYDELSERGVYALYKAFALKNSTNKSIVKSYQKKYIDDNVKYIKRHYYNNSLNSNFEHRLVELFKKGFFIILQRFSSHLSDIISPRTLKKDNIILPTIDTSEHNYTSYLKEVTSTLKTLMNMKPGSFLNGRIEEPITYHGSNKIICIAEIHNPYTSIPHLNWVDVYYGTVPNDFLTQLKGFLNFKTPKITLVYKTSQSYSTNVSV